MFDSDSILINLITLQPSVCDLYVGRELFPFYIAHISKHIESITTLRSIHLDKFGGAKHDAQTFRV